MTRQDFARALRNGSSMRSLAIALSVPFVFAASGASAASLPGGGHYVAGSGSISKSSGKLSIDQNSTTGIINWNTFSIGKGKTVDFNNGSGATLNRVTSGNLSTISGSLKATGSVYVINSAGVVVSRSGRIDTGGTFVASSRDESDSDFENGKRKFNGTSHGNVSNAGVIHSANGDVALIGRSATNSGKLSAANGTASVNAANHVLLAPQGAPVLISGGMGNATNSGTIAAAQAQLNAAGGNVYALAGNNGGVIRATGTSTIGGHVWLTSKSGDTSISGRVAAHNADGTGGTIEATGANLAVRANAHIDASGSKGGTILLGGDVHGGKIASDNFGKGHLQTASNTTVARGAKISASGTAGKGGNVVVWSDNHTKFEGRVSAKGAGAASGGFTEVSSHNLLGYRGHVDLTSARGQVGTLLLDPHDVSIMNAATAHGHLTGGTFTPSADGSILDVNVLESALTTASVVVNTGSTGTQTGNINVLAPITWGSDRALTLDAYHSVNVAANVNILGAGTFIVKTNDGGTGGAFNLQNGARIDYGAVNNGGILNINAHNYNLLYSMADVQNVNANMNDYYALATSINGVTGSWTPIGTSGGSVANGGMGFHGMFEGLGNTISGFADNGTDSNVGLFGAVSGTVRDVGLIGGSVSGTNNVGELVGNLKTSGTVLNSFSTGTVTGSGNYAGGLVGYASAGSSVVRSFATGDVNGGSYVGGLVGGNAGTAVYSYASGDVTGTTNNVGGFAGSNSGTMMNDYAVGDATGTANVGGFVGNNQAGGVIGIAYANGTATGANDGGFVGENDGIAGDSANDKIIYNTDKNAAGYGTNNMTVRQLGLTGAQMVDSTQYPTGYTYGTTGGASTGWVIVDLDGSLNNASSTGGTTPMLLSEYSQNIVTPHQLQLMELNLDSSADYNLETSYLNMGATNGGDIWTSAGFIAIGGNEAGSGGTYFDGYFRGNGGTIANLYINDSTNSYVGLFGETEALIENLNLTNFRVSASVSTAEVGTLAGYADGWITRVNADGVVTGSTDPYAGGLVGYNDYLIANSSAAVTVNDTDTTTGYAGGLTGYNDGTIRSSSASGIVRGQGGSEIGGLTGENDYIINNSFATGKVTGTNAFSGKAGGLVGYNSEGTISGSYATGDVTAVSSGSGDVGGLAGESYYASIANSYATGNVTGTDTEYLGGLVGYDEDDGAISHSYATGDVFDNYVSSTGASVGGLVGYDDMDTYGHISNSYATGAVVTAIPDSYVGGLVGQGDEYTWISSSYATGRVRATGDDSYAGGLAGYLSDYSNVTDSSATGSVTAAGGYSSVGGLVGELYDYSTISGSHASGDVTVTTDNTYAGGLVGYADEYTHTNSSFATGDVTASGEVYGGGLVGYMEYYNTIHNSHATGSVTVDGKGSDSYLGGLVGYADEENGIANSFAHGDVTGDLNAYAGGLLGYQSEYFTASDSYATGNVTGYTAGGFVGYDDDYGMYTNDHASGNVQGVVSGGYSYAGGFLGYGSSTWELSNVYATGNVSGGSTVAGDTYAGGLAGYVDTDEGIVNSHATGSVAGAYYAGGLVGDSDSDIADSYATGNVNGATDGDIGGLVGYNDGTITGSYATGNVKGVLGTDSYVGGLVGDNDSEIDHSYATGNVNYGGTEADAGGLVGYNDSDISYAYSTGNLAGDGNATSAASIGGLIGYQDGGYIDQVYSAAHFSGKGAGTDGGLIGTKNSTDPITNAYWDLTNSGAVTTSAGGVGLTTTQLQNGTLPSGFSSSDWMVTAGSYPVLK